MMNYKFFNFYCNSAIGIRRGNEYDDNNTVVYYNSYDPNDRKREQLFLCSLSKTSNSCYHYYIAGGDNTVGLYSQRYPFTEATRKEVDPNLGRHDDFLLVGPYIFAQRSESDHIHLYISYLRQPFNLAKIPSTDPHQVREYYCENISVC